MEGKYLVADGFDDAIIGIDMLSEKVIYDKYLMCEILMKQGLSEEDAIEFLAYNVFGAYVGEHTPIYVDVMDAEYMRNLLNENS